MDKLEPVLAHKFWIIAGVALILPSYGWWSASSELRSETESRRQTLEGTYGRIPKDAQIAEIPNKDWTAEVARQNKVREQQNKAAAAVLWEAQKELMVWPDLVAKDIAAAGYRGELPKDRQVARSYYRQTYPEQIRKLRSIVSPISPTNPDGLVQMPPGTLTQVPVGRWDQLPPTVEEMWNAQEDIWLQTALLDAIAEINKDATSIIDAPIKFIQKLQLRGGDRASADSGPTARAGGTQRPRSTSPIGNMVGWGNRRGRDAVAPAIKVDFDPAAEFGTPPQGSPVDEGRAGLGPGKGGIRIKYDEEEEEEDIGRGRRVEEETGPRVVRYVDDGTKTPYRTRAFYLKVIMDEREIPAFLTELTNSPWPVEIVRVHRVSLRETQEAEQLLNRYRRNQQNTGNTVQDKIASALSDPFHLSTVVVGGLLTLYNPVDQPKAGQAKPAAGDADAETAADTAGGAEPAGAAESETSVTAEDEAVSPSPEEPTPETAAPPAASEPEGTLPNQPESPPAGDQP